MRKSTAISRDHQGKVILLTGKHRVDHLKRLIDLFADLGTGQDDLAAHEDEKHNLGFDHTIDKTREQLRLVRAKVVMTASKAFETDRELDVAGADNVLDLEIGKFRIEPKLLDDTSIFARGKLRIILGLCASDNHLARSEDQSCSLWFADTHDNGRETLNDD